MNDLQYYTKEINDCHETQCQADLLNGKIKIADVPFAFRGHDEYISCAIFNSRTLLSKLKYLDSAGMSSVGLQSGGILPFLTSTAACRLTMSDSMLSAIFQYK